MDNNYAYLLIDKATKTAAVVDPADPFAVMRVSKTSGQTGNELTSATSTECLQTR